MSINNNQNNTITQHTAESIEELFQRADFVADKRDVGFLEINSKFDDNNMLTFALKLNDCKFVVAFVSGIAYLEARAGSTQDYIEEFAKVYAMGNSLERFVFIAGHSTKDEEEGKRSHEVAFLGKKSHEVAFPGKPYSFSVTIDDLEDIFSKHYKVGLSALRFHYGKLRQ